MIDAIDEMKKQTKAKKPKKQPLKVTVTIHPCIPDARTDALEKRFIDRLIVYATKLKIEKEEKEKLKNL